MKKLSYVLLLLLMITPLFSGIIYPEISLNKSLKLLLNKNTNYPYPNMNGYPNNPFYAFDYFPLNYGYLDKKDPYSSFFTKIKYVVPRLINTLHKASKIKNHAGANSIVRYIIEPNKNLEDPKNYKKSDKALALIWKRKQATLRQTVNNFIKNNSLNAPALNTLYDKKWIDLKAYKMLISKYITSLKTYKDITYEEFRWLLKNSNKNEDIIAVGKILLKWLQGKKESKIDNAAEYFLKYLDQIMNDKYLSSNIMEVINNKKLDPYYTDYNKLQDKLMSNYLIPLIFGIGLILLITLGIFFLKKKKQ